MTLTEIINEITGSPIYEDINQMYKDGIIDKKTYETIMVSFHQNMLPAALQMAKDLMLSLQEVEITKEDGTTETMTLQKAQILEQLERVNLVKEQVKTEIERTKLLNLQAIGFYDNRVIKITETMRGLVGEIESGGLENPQQNWDMLYSALNAMATIASAHPLVGAIAVPTTPPTGKQ
jgi:hypothetical protein